MQVERASDYPVTPVFRILWELEFQFRVTKLTDTHIIMRRVDESTGELTGTRKAKRKGPDWYVEYYGLDREATEKKFQKHLDTFTTQPL